MPHLSDPRHVARRRWLALIRHVPLARAGDVESVHQARVASRRLREFLPLLEPVPNSDGTARKIRRRVRTLTRALGPVRELDVALLALDDLAASRPDDGPAIEIVRIAVAKERLSAAERMDAALEGADLDRLRDLTVREATAYVSPAARRTMAGCLAARIEVRAEAARVAIEDAGTLYAQDRLHRARIALKKLRYTLELAEDCGRFRLAGTLRRLKGIQDILGVLHDDVVLAGRVRDCGAATRDAGEQAALSALASHLDEETRRRHNEFLRSRPALGVVFFWAQRAILSLGGRSVRPRPPSKASINADVAG